MMGLHVGEKMAAGLDKTLKLIADTRNDAALDTLVASLESSCEKTRERAFVGILTRRSPTGHRLILDRWDEWDDAWKERIGEHPGRLTSAIRDSVLSTQREVCESGCEALLKTSEFDLAPTLVKAIEERKNPNAELVSDALINLAELLRAELDAPRDYKRRRDPSLVQRNFVGCLEPAVERFPRYQRVVLIEAFLLLVEHDNALLRKTLQQPRGLLFQKTTELLMDSPRTGIKRLLLSFLGDRGAAKSALNAIARRTDTSMVAMFLDEIGQEPSDVVLNSLKRMNHVAWVINQPRLWASWTDEQQHAAVIVATQSGMNRIAVFDFLSWILKKGNVGGRRAAAEALDEFRGMEANEAARQALDDEDPIVLARILVQMRQRGIRVSLSRLMQLADSPHEEVRTAVQKCLGDFTLQRYLSAFDMLNDDIRKTTGLLVKKVDPNLIETLVIELESPARTRRIRALQSIPFLGVGSEVEPLLLEAIEADDHFVRAEAARAMVNCNSKESQQALREALLDSWSSVQDAAEQTLQDIVEAKHNRGALQEELNNLFDEPLPPELGMEFLA